MGTRPTPVCSDAVGRCHRVTGPLPKTIKDSQFLANMINCISMATVKRLETRWKNMAVVVLLQATPWLLAGHARGAAPLVVEQYPLAQAVLTNSCIMVCATGEVAVSWQAARNMLGRPRLFDDVQRAYVATLPAGRKPGFIITPDHLTRHMWHYLNKDGEPSDIVEVARCGPDGQGAELLFRVDGRRFFGLFQVVLAIRAYPHGPDTTHYAADVWAYPENGAVRFFVRHLGLVEHFFRNKTSEIEKIARDIALQLSLEQPGGSPPQKMKSQEAA